MSKLPKSLKSRPRINEKVAVKQEVITTTLKFRFLDKTTKDFLIYSRPQNYTDIQREIARVYPNMRRILVVQYDNGKLVTAKDFQPSEIFVIREFENIQKPSLDPIAPVRWEFKTYHAAPPNWESYEERKERIIKEVEDERLRKVAEDDTFAQKLALEALKEEEQRIKNKKKQKNQGESNQKQANYRCVHQIHL